jgi:hypothetical protein
MTQKHVLGVLAFSVANFVLALLFLPQPQPQFAEYAATPVLSLADMPSSDSATLASAYQSLRQHQPWGAEAPSTAATVAEKPQAQARFAGVVYEGTQAYVLMLEEEHHLRRYGIGDILPLDALRLRAVHADAVEVESTETREILYLYPRQ